VGRGETRIGGDAWSNGSSARGQAERKQVDAFVVELRSSPTRFESRGCRSEPAEISYEGFVSFQTTPAMGVGNKVN
jgi:hypothetical protein